MARNEQPQFEYSDTEDYTSTSSSGDMSGTSFSSDHKVKFKEPQPHKRKRVMGYRKSNHKYKGKSKTKYDHDNSHQYSQKSKKRLEKDNNRLVEISVTEGSLFARWGIVALASFLVVINLILSLSCTSLTRESVTKTDCIEEKNSLRLFMLVLGILSFIAHSMRILNYRIVLFTFLTITLQFITFAFGLGIIIYILVSNNAYDLKTKVPTGFGYFIFSIACTALAVIILLFDFFMTKDFKHKGSGVSYKLKLLQISFIAVYAWVMLGGLLFKYLEGKTILVGVYYCLVTATTTGFGDYVPTTSLAKFIMVPWAIFGIMIMSIYAINFGNFVVSLLDVYKLRKMAQLISEQLALKINDIDKRTGLLTRKRIVRSTMKKAKGKKLQIGLTNTGFHIAGLVKKHTVGDDNAHNDGHSPHGHQTEKSNDHPVTKYIENHLAGGILTTHHYHNYDKDTPFVQYDALEQQIVALKSSSRITLSLGLVIVFLLGVWVFFVTLFHIFQDNEYSYGDIIYLCIIAYSTVVFKTEGSLIYYSITAIYMVSIFGLMIATVSQLVQNFISTAVKKERLDIVEEKMIEKVQEIIERRTKKKR